MDKIAITCVMGITHLPDIVVQMRQFIAFELILFALNASWQIHVISAVLKICLYCNNMSLKDIAGKPGEGVHAMRFCGMAAFDLLGTVIIAVVVAFYMGWGLISTTIGTFLLGQAFHLMFGVDTQFVKWIKG